MIEIHTKPLDWKRVHTIVIVTVITITTLIIQLIITTLISLLTLTSLLLFLFLQSVIHWAKDGFVEYLKTTGSGRCVLTCFTAHGVACQVISDLLKPERTNLVIREDRKRGVFVDGLSEWVVRSPAEVSLVRGRQPLALGSFSLVHAYRCLPHPLSTPLTQDLRKRVSRNFRH